MPDGAGITIQLWSDDARNPDEDPSVWYNVFEELVDSTLKAK